MKKKLEILVYHLGYGGIEKAVSSLVEVFKNDYEISILSFYRLYNQPVFVIDSNIPIRYLYETDVPLKVKKYNQLIKKKQIGKLLQVLWNDYGKGFHFLTFFHDLFYSIQIYFLKGIIIKSTGSWYQVLEETDKTVYEARIRGKFKLIKTRLTNPLAVGD